MAQPSYYDGQYSTPASADGRYSSAPAGYSSAADAGYSLGYSSQQQGTSAQFAQAQAATSSYAQASTHPSSYAAGQFLDYRGGGASTGQTTHASELGYAGNSYAAASAAPSAAAPMYTAGTGGSYALNSSALNGAFDPSNLGFPSMGQSSYSQGAFGAPSFSQGANSMLQSSTIPQAGSFTAAPPSSFSYQATGQDTFNGLPSSGSFVAGGFDASGGAQLGGPMGQFSNPFLAAMYSTLNGQTDPRHWPQFDVPNMPYAAATRTETRVEPVVRREYDRPQPEAREERAQDLGGGVSLGPPEEDPTKKLLEAKEKEEKRKRKKEKEEKSGFWFWTCS
jgi:hypothetical protein